MIILATRSLSRFLSCCVLVAGLRLVWWLIWYFGFWFHFFIFFAVASQGVSQLLVTFLVDLEAVELTLATCRLLVSFEGIARRSLTSSDIAWWYAGVSSLTVYRVFSTESQALAHVCPLKLAATLIKQFAALCSWLDKFGGGFVFRGDVLYLDSVQCIGSPRQFSLLLFLTLNVLCCVYQVEVLAPPMLSLLLSFIKYILNISLGFSGVSGDNLIDSFIGALVFQSTVSAGRGYLS